jgi:translocation and assembly module TamA
MRWPAAALLLILTIVAGVAQAAPQIIVQAAPDETVVPSAVTSVRDAVGVIARQADDEDAREADRLRRRARDAALSALSTQGYFNAQVDLKTGKDDKGQETWTVEIRPGTRATVESVDLRFTGRIADPRYAQRVAAARKAWAMADGTPFVNDDWTKAKAALLDAVAEKDFLLARITASAADVDAETGKVRLAVTIDSGPTVHMGLLEIEGLKRVPSSLVKRYVRYTPGDVYDQNQLNTWQQQLQGTDFFRGAFVSMQVQDGQTPSVPSTAQPAKLEDSAATADARARIEEKPAVVPQQTDITLPVKVRLVEGQPKNVAASLGVDNEAGVRAEVIYTQHVVFGQPITLQTGAGADRLQQRVFADFLLPPDARGNKDSIGVLAQHSDIQGLEVTRFGLGARRVQERQSPTSRVDYTTTWGVLAAYDKVNISGGDSYNLPTVTGTVDWLRRDVDNKYNPRQGNLIDLGAGVGVVLDTGKPYSRLQARGQKWWPVGKLDVFTVRGEVGKLFSDSQTQVPDDFGFRTGGARSIRGYEYLSIGAKRDGAVVGAPALLVGSIEYDHYFNDRWGIGYFIDAGDAAQSFGSMKMNLGYGVGLRVRTPAGPLFLDVAYAQSDHRPRIDFSLGIAF